MLGKQFLFMPLAVPRRLKCQSLTGGVPTNPQNFA
jgi:hypothetical protein